MSYADSNIRIQLAKTIQENARSEVVIVFIDISESTSHQLLVGVGSAIDRMVGLSFSLIQNLSSLKRLVKFEPKHIVKSIGDELMLALPLPEDQNKKSEFLVRLIDALNKTIVEEEQHGVELRTLIPVAHRQEFDVQVYKISIGVCQDLVRGHDILEFIKTIQMTPHMTQRFRQRIFRPDDFWGTDVNQTARITGLSGNKVILVNAKAHQLIESYTGDKSFSCTELYSFAAKGLGEMAVSQVIQDSDESLPHIVKKYGYCCLLFIDIQNFELEMIPIQEKITQQMVDVMKRHFSPPTLAFGYKLDRKIGGYLKETGLDFVFAVMSQDFEKYQSKVGDVIKEMRDPYNINYTISYPLWRPFEGEIHPFFQYTKEREIRIEVPEDAIISMASFGSTEKALNFRTAFKSGRLWNVFGDVDVVGIHSRPAKGNTAADAAFAEQFKQDMRNIDHKRYDDKYQTFWEAERIYPVT